MTLAAFTLPEPLSPATFSSALWLLELYHTRPVLQRTEDNLGKSLRVVGGRKSLWCLRPGVNGCGFW